MRKDDAISTRSPHECRRLDRPWLAGAFWACWLSLPVSGLAGGHPVPLALPGTTAPWTVAQEEVQNRRLEAETKTRALFAHAQTGSGLRNKATANLDRYDVTSYDLVLELNPLAEILTGTGTVRATVTAADLVTLELDLASQLSVSAVRSAGMPAIFSHANDLVTITLDRTYSTGEEVTVAVDYAGDPSGAYFGWAQYGGQPLIWTLSEPYGARGWWPCKDLNSDKADSVALHVTVPESYVVASNGTLDQVTSGSGLKTYHWTERYPIATYLVSVTAHPFATFSDEYVSAQGDTMPLEYFVVPDKLATARSGYAVVPEMIATFAGLFGPYPFLAEKYGHAHFPWGGGMEHQTCTSLNLDGYSEGLISHELGHQWFGDLVTCADFAHIWINEGFATWCEAYWREQKYGEAAYRDEMNQARYLGPGTIIVENPGSFSTIFDWNLTYQKASWVPHMLRHVVGEAQFQTGLQTLLTDFGFGTATTADVQSVFETVSGLDLEAFFQQWIYGEYFPAYVLSWTGTPEGAQTRVRIKIEQVQTVTGLFTMPLDVRISTTNGDTTVVVQNSEAEQWYDFLVDGTAFQVLLDPDSWVLRSVDYAGASDVPKADEATVVLRDNVPNPFNPTTVIRFSLRESREIRLDIHDLAGRLVKNLVAGSFGSGDHQVRWNGTDAAGRAVASGTYFVRLHGAGTSQVRPMTLVR